ncbi:acetoacetate--CoA ligase [Amylibacter sp.]|nr:acetoacetate--CoA ligase [Amylibacter sp.]
MCIDKQEPIWRPSTQRVKKANITSFCEYLQKSELGNFEDYDALWDWSVTNIENFWSAFWDYGNIQGSKGDVVLTPCKEIINAKFFPNGKINYAENVLNASNNGPAIIFHDEGGARTEWSWKELYNSVSLLQQSLRESGVQKGDRVAGIVPNSPYTIVALLAVSSIGAVWSSCSPDFGLSAALDRISQIEPKVLFCADGYQYNGKEISNIKIAADLTSRVPSIQKTIIFPLNHVEADISLIGEKGILWSDYLAPFAVQKIHYERVNFNDPLFIMFSSGTTGLPKCIVHSVGGTLLQHVKEHQLQSDIKMNDRLLYFTTCGWMMWNWMVSGLASGATLVLFDGSPFFPDGNRLANIISEEKVTHFGTSAKYLDACSKTDVKPMKTHDLTKLRTILSTGSPLSEVGFDYVYKNWKKDVCLSSIAGGTDILGCFVGGSPTSPVFKGECQKRHLAMNVKVYNDDGKEIQNTRGELVCESPHPSMPIGFWNDKDNVRYKSAYFEKFENVWHQGDFVELTANKGLRFFGRSDAVLNPGGVRIGTAEIYRVVEAMEEVIEGVVIGQNIDDDQRVVLFLRIKENVLFNEALVKKIKLEIRAKATPRHVPAVILKVKDIPRTKSGKIAEIAVRDTVHGHNIKNMASLANPEAIEYFKNIKELNVIS